MTLAKARILDAAMACFASKGYAATTMADIEEAAGFVPRTGGTYRHFKSKQAILEAAIDAHLAVNDDVLAPAPTSLEDAARDGLAQLDRQRELTRVLFRDLDRFPELMERVVDRLIQGPYRLVAERTAAVAPNVDAEAVAVLMIGALVNFKVIEALVGERPGGISEERLVDIWAKVYGLILKEGNTP
jgi:AcrR family transcriptional regulator